MFKQTRHLHYEITTSFLTLRLFIITHIMKHLLKKIVTATIVASAPFFCMAQAPFKMGNSSAEKVKINVAYSDDAILKDFAIPKQPATGVSVDASITLKSKAAFVRLVLIDSQYNEYLIFETNHLLAPKASFSIKDYSDETADLPSVIISSIKIEAEDADVEIKAINIATSKATVLRSANANGKKEEKYQYKLAKIKQKIKDDNLPWFAGETNISKLSYAEKKAIMGDGIDNMQGIEYYKGGVFVISGTSGDESKETQTAVSTVATTTEAPSAFVKEFSWRNRHGESWITPAKSQRGNTCWAFATASSIEQMVNMYYNDPTIDLDLSEQQLVSCSGGGSYAHGGNPYRTYPYTKTTGIVNEGCFEFVGDTDCDGLCLNPQETIIHEDSEGVSNQLDSIKAAIIHRPLAADIRVWSHAINLIGYKELSEGDVIHTIDNTYPDYVVEKKDDLIGKTVWEIKNSWGTTDYTEPGGWGVDGCGFVYLTNSVPSANGPTGHVSSLNFTDADIQCLDRDGDGYYTWGTGPKPAHCPACPDEPDGDDSDPNYGPMDYYGNLTFLGQSAYATMTIPGVIEAENYDITISDPTYYDHDAVNNGGAYRNDGIDIASGGIDGGYNIGWITPGEWTEYTIASIDKDRYNISFAVASPGPDAGSSIKMSINGEEVTTVDVINTGGWGNWQTIDVIGVHIAPGENKILRFDFTGGYYNFDKVTITPDPGLPPVADAGDDMQKMDIDEDGTEQFNLNANNSSDPEGMPLIYRWSNNDSVFYESEYYTAYVTLPIGIHTITLTVIDEDGNESSDQMTITVKTPNHIPPVAIAGPDIILIDEDGDGFQPFVLDGSASFDPEGQQLTYGWKEGMYYVGSGMLFDVNFPVGRTATFVLVVTDSDGYTDSDTINITVKGKAFKTLYVPGTIEAEDYDQSLYTYYDTDSENTGGEYRTESVDIEQCSTGGYNITAIQSGEYVKYSTEPIPLGTYDISFVVAAENPTEGSSLSLYFNSDYYNIDIPTTGGDQTWQTITIEDVAVTTDIWNSIQITFYGSGYNFDKMIFTPTSNLAPIADAGQDIIVTDNDNNGTETVALMGSAIDYDGDALTYQWTDAEGTTLSNALSLTATLSVGVHTLTFTATDSNGGQSSDEITVTVLPIADDGQDPYATLSIPGIIEAEDYDLGGEGIAYHDADATNSGGEYRTDGVDISQTPDGDGYNLGWFYSGEWTEYTIASVEEGTYTIGLNFASPGPINGAAVTVSLGGTVLGTASVPNTGDWNDWQTVYIRDISLPAMEDAVLRLDFEGEMYNFDKISFYPAQEGNIIINGTFEQGSTAWQSYIDQQANAYVDFETNYEDCRVVIYEGGSEVWHTQLYQTGLLIEQGQSYLLTFSAKTYGHITSAMFDVQVEENGGDYTAYMQPQRRTVTPGSSTHAFIFTMNEPTDPDARLTFNMGMNEDPGGGYSRTIGFDNISIVPYEGSSSTMKYEYSVLPDAEAEMQPDPLSIAPNPASKEATVSFSLSSSGNYSIVLAPANGTEGTVVNAGYAQAGAYEEQIDVTTLPTGLYICTLKTEDKTETAMISVQ